MQYLSNEFGNGRFWQCWRFNSAWHANSAFHNRQAPRLRYSGAVPPTSWLRIPRMKKVTIWHNARCSKSRETLDLLRSHNIEPEILEYLQTPPAEAEIARVLALLGLEPRELMRSNESAYHEQKLADTSLDRQALIAAMHRYPILIQRPVVITADKARIGRPPEAVLEIL